MLIACGEPDRLVVVGEVVLQMLGMSYRRLWKAIF